MSKSEVSRLAQELDAEVEAFRHRPLEGPYRYLWLDALYPKVREGGRVVGLAVMVAMAVNAKGKREVMERALEASRKVAAHAARALPVALVTYPVGSALTSAFQAVPVKTWGLELLPTRWFLKPLPMSLPGTNFESEFGASRRVAW